MKKSLLSLPLFAAALMFAVNASAQQPAPVTEDAAYELPAMVSEKTVPLFDEAFKNLPGVSVSFYCYNLSLVVFRVDRTVQKDNISIEQKIHSIFNTDNSTMRLESKQSFNKNAYLVMCNAGDLITR